ncbi:DUF7521 family protein [Natrialba swarupiae]|uniref:Uncharacterized protein n=1 Tax=Natrialba swarupiae TaxID=2448032 RepID=A0A5D5ASD2_9EURY|nr:hypothetical protein [Natrialba swarupiae]TYT63953.1 hypothetical protein FYC77_01745 [Natrialba swarupiae]
MLETPLQVHEVFRADQFELAMLGINFLKGILGFVIAYIAYRGYRRNESRPMLYLSTGFVLVLGVPFVFFVVAISLVGAIGPVAVLEQGVVAVAELSQVIGLLVIVYALRM